ncbi:MAG: hypothetical protein JW836_11225 [Deltaproteobacteria bacterium]|nr:hypothetical protein [Deltaproteobacteria bacterium]
MNAIIEHNLKDYEFLEVLEKALKASGSKERKFRDKSMVHFAMMANAIFEDQQARMLKRIEKVIADA